MKKLIVILIILQTILIFGEKIKTIETTIKRKLDFSKKAQEEWIKANKIISTKKWSDCTKEEKDLVIKYKADEKSNMWDAIGDGCSWYCGAGAYKVRVSSELKPNGNDSFKAEYISDLSFKTTWIEGKKGYGIGETIEFVFPPEHPRVTKVIIVNGYVQSKEKWRNYSRVKKLKMYINNKPFAIINLKDFYGEQSFNVKPIGYSDRFDYQLLKKKPPWSIKFEIMDVYKGNRFDHTAITEIYFDGLDVHCLAKGTLIAMGNNTKKKIENLQKGDIILSYNLKNKIFEKSRIINLIKIRHNDLVQISFSNGSKISCTRDHPFLSINNSWVSVNPEKTKLSYNINNIKALKINTKIITNDTISEVIKIKKIKGTYETFTILKLEKNKTFIANNIITRTR